VDLRASTTGGSWITLRSWTADTANPQHESVDLSPYAAGDIQLRWRYAGANYDWYWYVDNVQVGYASPPSCTTRPCTVHAPAPGEQTGVAWPSGSLLAWDADPAASGGYILYRGGAGGLPALAGPGTDSCIRLAGTAPGADLSGDDPGAGKLFWYLVTGWNADGGEGTAGSGTVATRIVNSSGPCGG
jgi:hypothetical protein